MRQIYILIIILFYNFYNLSSQTIEVATGLLNPRGMTFVNNELYFCELFKVSKIDLTSNTPNPQSFASNLLLPESITKNGDNLYIAEYNGNKISKINIASTTSNTSDIITGLNGPTGILFNGNDLYFAQALAGKISKIDITETTPTIIDVVTGLNGPTGIILIENNIFISEVYSGKISKIDITETNPTVIDVVTGLTSPRGIAFSGNNIYIAEFGAKKISKIDISTTAPTPTDVVIGLDGPQGLTVNENNLYISDSNDILKLDLTTLFTNNLRFVNSINLYPNPASGFIKISGLTQTENYKIYNVLGEKVVDGNIFNNEKLFINELENGLYFLKFDNGNKIKFIKN